MTLPGFSECPECEGGIDLSDDGYPTGLPCPSCSGLGVVPDPETVEAVYPVIERTSANAADWHEVARAALLAYARKAKENTVSETFIRLVP